MVGHILGGNPSFLSAAGHVGPKVRFDHDVSLLVPEVWTRMTAEERQPAFLLEHGYLEKCEDFEWNGRTVEASRLGYRITAKFGRVFFGRVFTHPHSIFTDEMLRPEIQDMDVFVDGLDNVCSTHQRVAQSYFDDGTIEMACPPLRALLHVMANGEYEGMDRADPKLRSLFTREHLLGSDWYAARLRSKQEFDQALWAKHVSTLQAFIAGPNHEAAVNELGLGDRLAAAAAEASRVAGPDYLASLVGTLGRQPEL